MFVVKFCLKEHHILTTKTIQIGTLNYYKNIDNKFIRDSSEGSYGHVIQSDKKDLQLKRDNVKQLFDNRLSAPITVKKGGKVVKQTQYPNVYIFCCSLVNDPTLKMAKDLGYNSYYYIHDLDNFMRLVEEQFSWVFRLKVNDKKKTVYLKRVHGPVSYEDDKKASYDFIDPEIQTTHLRNLFTKPKVSKENINNVFEHNKEYRFAWIPVDSNRFIVEVDDDPIYIRTNPFSFITCG